MHAFSRNHTIQIDQRGTAHIVQVSQDERRIRLALQILDVQTSLDQLRAETAPVIECLRNSFTPESLPAVFSRARESAEFTARTIVLIQIESNDQLRTLFVHHRPSMEQLIHRVVTDLLDNTIPTN